MHISKENYKYTITMKDFKTPFSQLARIDSQKIIHYAVHFKFIECYISIISQWNWEKSLSDQQQNNIVLVKILFSWVE